MFHLILSCKRLFIAAAVIVLLLGPASKSVIAGDDNPPESSPAAPIGKQVILDLPKQEWESRRANFWKTVQGVKLGNAEAIRDFDAKLTEFEKKQFYRTPMENMDILGVFYVPKDDPKSTLIIIAANAALGWYDAMRFGSESGRAEIMQNEKFFMRPYFLSGQESVEKIKQLLQEHPDQAEAAVQLGLSFADKERVHPHYDTHWPTAYGLERIICAQGGSCEPLKEMPEDQWDATWEAVKRKVVAYYRAPATSK